MNLPAIKAIVKKDVGSIGSSAQMWLPMILVPLIFVVVYPLIIIASFKSGASNMTNGNGAEFLFKIIDSLPAGGIKTQILAFPDLSQQIAYLFVNYLFSPLFMLIPVMVASIISANSFAGEKEKKTLETLLFSPIGERDLLLAKVLASFFPAQIITIFSALIYGAVIDIAGYSFFGRMIFPSSNWIVAVFWISPSISLLAVLINVFISAKVKGYQEAQQLSIIVILPVIALFIAQIMGFLFLGNLASFLVGTALFALDAVCLRLAPKTFNRQKMFLSRN